MTKNVLTAKTNWLGVLMIAVAVLDFLGASPLLAAYAPHILLVSGVLTVVLRQLTSLPTSMRARVRARDVMR